MASGERFPPQCRIRKRKEFLQIQSSGHKYRSSHFLLIISFPKLGTLAHPVHRLGITVTTKIDKRAAHRNRLKRRIREIFRREKRKLKISADLVLIAFAGACELDFDGIYAEILLLFKRAGLYRL